MTGRLRVRRVNTRLAVLYLIICLIWGTTWYAMKTAVTTLPPMTAAGLRFAGAFPFLALAVWRAPGGSFRLPREARWLLPFVTVVYIIVPYTLINIGEEHMDSGLAAILFSSVTVFLLVFSRLLSGTQVIARQWFGVIAGLVCLTFLIVGAGGGLKADSVLAPVAVLAAAVMHALTYAVLGRYSKGVSVLTLEALPIGIGGFGLLLLGIATEHPRFGQVSASSWIAVAYLAVIASVIGFAVYFYLVQRIDPILLSFVFILFPVVAVALSAVVDHAKLTVGTAMLAAATLGCFALAKKPTEDATETAAAAQPRDAGRTAETERIKSLLTEPVLAELARHAIDEFPAECCGFVLDHGVRPAGNAADRYHADAPDAFTRTAETGFVLGAADALFLDSSQGTDDAVRILYHSHPNGRAYFSEEDLRQSLFEGEPVYPDLLHLVVGIDARGPREARLFEIKDARAVELGFYDLFSAYGHDVAASRGSSAAAANN